MKKGIAFLAAFCLSVHSYSQAYEVGRQMQKATVSLLFEVKDWAIIVAQGSSLVERTQYTAEMLSNIKDDYEEIKRLKDGDGMKAYAKLYPTEAKRITTRVRFSALKIASFANILLQIGIMVDAFPQDVVKEAMEGVGDDVTTLSDGSAFLARYATILSPLDATATTNSTKELRRRETKNMLKKKIIDIMLMLNQIDAEIYTIYSEEQILLDNLRQFNNEGLLFLKGNINSVDVAWLKAKRKNLSARDAMIRAKRIEKENKRIDELTRNNNLIQFYDCVPLPNYKNLPDNY